MEFNNPTNGSGIVQDVWHLTKTDATSFPLADIARIANKVAHNLGLLAWKSDNSWKFDDSNHTDFPIATDDLVDGQEDYAIPTTTFDIKRVEVKNSAGNWVKLKYITHQEIPGAIDEFEKTPGMPVYYLLEGHSVRLKPAPAAAAVTLSEGLKLYMSRDVTEFTASSTTTTPGFPSSLHQLFPYEIALEYASINGLQNLISFLSSKVAEGRQAFIDYYAHRGGEIKPRLKTRSISYE